MKRITILLILLIFPVLSKADQQYEEILTAWEDIQRNNPKVELLEPVSDGMYSYKNKSLQYDGKLEIIDIMVEDNTFDGTELEGIKIATVDAFLTDFNDRDGRFARAFGKWQMNNTLYYNPETETWIGWDEYQEVAKELYNYSDNSSGFMTWLSEYWYIIFLFILAYFVLETIINRRTVNKSVAEQHKAIKQQEKVLELQEKGIAVAEKTNALLSELNEHLKKRNL